MKSVRLNVGTLDVNRITHNKVEGNMARHKEFITELTELVNRNGLDSLSKIPDFIIANSLYTHFLNMMIAFGEYRHFNAEKESDNGLHE